MEVGGGLGHAKQVGRESRGRGALWGEVESSEGQPCAWKDSPPSRGRGYHGGPGRECAWLVGKEGGYEGESRLRLITINLPHPSPVCVYFCVRVVCLYLRVPVPV